MLLGRSKSVNLKLLVSEADFGDDEDDEDYSGGEDNVPKSASVATPKGLFSPTTPKEPTEKVTSAAPAGGAMYSVFCKGKLKFSKKSGAPIWAGFWAESLKELGPGSHTRYKLYYEKQNASKDKKKDVGRAVDPEEFSGTYRGYFMVKNQVEPTGDDIRKKEVDVTIKFSKNADQPDTFTVHPIPLPDTIACGVVVPGLL